MENYIISYRNEYVGKNYKIKYYADISCSIIGEHKTISASEEYLLNEKVNIYLEKLENKIEKYNIKQQQQASQSEVEQRTENAIKLLKDTEDILLYTLDMDDRIDWETLKNNEKYKENKPSLPQKPDYITPSFTFWDNILTSRKEKKISEEKKIYNQKLKEYEKNMTEYNKKLQEYETAKSEFYNNQSKNNLKIDNLKSKYEKKNTDSITEYCDLVLSNSQYPFSFSQSFEIDYNPENKILIIEYSLPNQDQIPKLNEIKFIKSKNEMKEVYISQTAHKNLFEKTIYNISLRSLHEIFEADVVNGIDSIVFNGWVEHINKATGNIENTCILSIHVKKEDFEKINLQNIDPKTCFKSLKGVAASKISSISPIKPILKINKTDKRFTSHYDIADNIDQSTNLASMDWQDFEHLIREVFAKEFSSNGGEVNVTQASKDGGVDAIAFDPDPIRGGKIVIQAKRYTNTVGVSAVRDLYGTVHNEGATKGVLVTTADFGPDAYDFVKDKPLTLINGANLLYLLEKHGHQAKIDIKEAKKELS